FMRAEWKGALTGRSTLFFPPRSAAALTARSTAPRCPAMTICPGELMFATFTTSPCAASAHACSAAASSSPSSAAMAPVPTGTALPGTLAELAARAHEPYGIDEAESARDHERGVLAEAVAGTQVGIDPALRQGSGRRHACRENRGLSVGGEGELVLGPLEAE